MKFIALVSGGKDSCFNIIHCLNAGHELVAMANLHPKAGRPEEIDSWMFQTVGYKSVELLAECAGVPLYRAEISEDEESVVVELASLFDSIRAKGIAFDGVSVGAIGSTYQQVRVDKACEMSGLRSLAYLWQRDQSELLHEIVESGLDARIIKVAGMGLGERHLGMSLAEAETELLDLHKNTGLHPCGEGGEYETMVFDAPFFKKQRMVIAPGSEKVVHHSTDDVFYLEFAVDLDTKEPEQQPAVQVPMLLEPRFSSLVDTDTSCKPVAAAGETSSFPSKLINYSSAARNLGPVHRHLTFSGSFKQVFTDLESVFATEVDIHSCYHVEVVVQSMVRFGEMNELYSHVFKNSTKKLGDIPPSRVCIQAPIPGEIELTIFFTKEIDPSGKGIHVQGLSYWAPASIGPYSQCRLVYGISYAAGQIGLVPQSLELVDDSRITEALLALQDAFRILDVMHEFAANWEPLLAIAYITDPGARHMVQNIWTRVSSLPLMVAVVEVLPRNAQFEWSLQSCDRRYFSWFIPDNDEDEELYSAKPEFLYQGHDGYVIRSGFETLKVRCNESLQNAHLVFSPKARSTKTRHWIPTSSVYYNGNKVDEIYVEK